MTKIDWRSLFEAIGLVAVVLSLIFVGLQLRQVQVLARSELGAGSTELSAEILMNALESEFQKHLKK